MKAAGAIPKKRVFSGMQPSGAIHIGNYLGAIRQWVAAQQEFECVFCIVDLHAITVLQNPEGLKRKTREVAGLLIAAGVDPERSTLFVQSRVSAHAELTWILNCLIPMGWMQRMTQFKDKIRKGKDSASVGLFDYPALMAADILLYDSDLVPVGEDQTQHLELTRNIAARFNALYGTTFKVPEALVPEVGARIMGLDDPLTKMSKSNTRKNHALNLLDDADTIRTKIAGAATDSELEIRFDRNRPGIYNLLVIYELLTGLGRKEIENRFSNRGYAQFKKELAEVIVEYLRPLQDRYSQLAQDPNRINMLLGNGAANAQEMAEKKLRFVKEQLGLG
jgi:tryptophanyl-tRNA synthetase